MTNDGSAGTIGGSTPATQWCRGAVEVLLVLATAVAVAPRGPAAPAVLAVGGAVLAALANRLATVAAFGVSLILFYLFSSTDGWGIPLLATKGGVWTLPATDAAVSLAVVAGGVALWMDRGDAHVDAVVTAMVAAGALLALFWVLTELLLLPRYGLDTSLGGGVRMVVIPAALVATLSLVVTGRQLKRLALYATLACVASSLL